jgi:hypothetical protein
MASTKLKRAALDKVTGLRSSRITITSKKGTGAAVMAPGKSYAVGHRSGKTSFLAVAGKNYGEGGSKTAALESLKKNRKMSAAAASYRRSQRRDSHGKWA